LDFSFLALKGPQIIAQGKAQAAALGHAVPTTFPSAGALKGRHIFEVPAADALSTMAISSSVSL
jgi:hypothetical protein